MRGLWEGMEEPVPLWGRSCCVFMAQGRSVHSAAAASERERRVSVELKDGRMGWT